MKQVYALLLFIFIYSIANAQVKQGEVVLGGNLDYSDQSTTSVMSTPPVVTKTNSFEINPSIGKAIKDNLILGIDLGYMHSYYIENQTGVYPYHQMDNTFTAGVFVRRYKLIGAGFSVFGQAEFSGNYSHQNNSYAAGNLIFDHYNDYGFSLSVHPGIAYAFNRRWQIEAGLPNFLAVTYTHEKETEQSYGQSVQTGRGHSISFASSLTGATAYTVGVRYFVGG